MTTPQPPLAGRLFRGPSRGSLFRVLPRNEIPGHKFDPATGRWVSDPGKFLNLIDLEFKIRTGKAYLVLYIKVPTTGEFRDVVYGTCKDKKLGPILILDWLMEHADKTDTDPELVRAAVRLFLTPEKAAPAGA